MRFPVSRPLYSLLSFFQFPVAWEVSVGTVVFRTREGGDREYLLLHYPSGHFDFPKGHIESGETEEMTARRETQEETGLADLTLHPHRISIRYFYRARGAEYGRRKREGRGTWIFKLVHFYPAETIEREVKLSHEHIGSCWLPFAEALNRVTFDNARVVLGQVESWLHETRG